MTYIKNNPTFKKRRKELRHNQTEAEKVFWSHVRDKKFCDLKFFRQYSIGPYILDFYSPAVKIAVELDGGQHNNCDSREYDAERSEYLKAQGIDVMRFWNHDLLQDIQAVLAKLETRVTPLIRVTPPLSPS